MQVQRSTLANVLVVVFVLTLVVMGTGAWLSYAAAPPIPDRVLSDD